MKVMVSHIHDVPEPLVSLRPEISPEFNQIVMDCLKRVHPSGRISGCFVAAPALAPAIDLLVRKMRRQELEPNRQPAIGIGPRMSSSGPRITARWIT